MREALRIPADNRDAGVLIVKVGSCFRGVVCSLLSAAACRFACPVVRFGACDVCCDWLSVRRLSLLCLFCLSQPRPLTDAAKVLQPNDVLLAFDGVPVASDGTISFRDGERVSFGASACFRPIVLLPMACSHLLTYLLLLRLLWPSVRLLHSAAADWLAGLLTPRSRVFVPRTGYLISSKFVGDSAKLTLLR